MRVAELRDVCRAFDVRYGQVVPGIYLIYCQEDRKGYIGSTCDLYSRWVDQHRPSLRGGRHHCAHLRAAWAKYGEAAFEFAVVEVCASDDPDHLLQRENHWLAQVPRGELFNHIVPAVRGQPRGFTYKHTEEAKAKLSRAKTGVKTGPQTPEWVAKRAEAVRKAHSDGSIPAESLEKMRHRGEESGTAKLTTEQVYDIRSLEGVESMIAVGKRYGVHFSAVQRIWKRKTWGHLPER